MSLPVLNHVVLERVPLPPAAAGPHVSRATFMSAHTSLINQYVPRLTRVCLTDNCTQLLFDKLLTKSILLFLDDQKYSVENTLLDL